MEREDLELLIAELEQQLEEAEAEASAAEYAYMDARNVADDIESELEGLREELSLLADDGHE